MSRFEVSQLLRLIPLAWAMLTAATAGAHDFFAGYIQHRIEITAGAKQLDVTIQLTFFEDVSEHERADMDTNGDGRVSDKEVEAYLKELESGLAKAVTLRIDGRAVTLLALYPPELDLLENARTGRTPHRLTLHYFAPGPPELRAGAELTIGDRLWPQVRALGALQAVGKDGCRLETVAREDPVFAPAKEKEERLFKARVLAAPRPGPAPSPEDSVQKHRPTP